LDRAILRQQYGRLSIYHLRAKILSAEGRSLADLEIPQGAVAGDLAILAGESELLEAKPADAVFLANGPGFERSPRDFIAMVRAVRETLGPSKVVAVTGIATPSNLSILVYSGIDLVDSSRLMLESARGLFHTADGVSRIDDAGVSFGIAPDLVVADVGAGKKPEIHANAVCVYGGLVVFKEHLLRALVDRGESRALYSISRITGAQPHTRFGH